MQCATEVIIQHASGIPEINNRICLVHADPIHYILAMKVSREGKKCLFSSSALLLVWLAKQAWLSRLGQQEEMEPVVIHSYYGITWRQTVSKKCI